MSTILLWVAYILPFIVIITPLYLLITFLVACSNEWEWKDAFADALYYFMVLICILVFLALFVWGVCSSLEWSTKYTENYRKNQHIEKLEKNL